MLSICIPTFERWPFLAWTLDRLGRDFPDAEIVVSDNCSASAAQEPFRTPARWIWQDSNIGPFPNMLAAFSAATGDYAVYCADDDYVLPDEIARGIDYLDRHPEVAAYCAPCEIYDEVGQKTYWNAFKVGDPVTFTSGIDLFNFIISHHVWPEHLIYRVPVPLKPRTRAYWAFADLPDILATGAIHFSPVPFYRNVLFHPVGPRVQLGNEQCLTHFDEYRAGLEVLAHGLFGQQPYVTRHRIQEMISSFICARLENARQLYARNGDELNARMLAARLSIASPVRDAV